MKVFIVTWIEAGFLRKKKFYERYEAEKLAIELFDLYPVKIEVEKEIND